jgi:hypothetical protein
VKGGADGLLRFRSIAWKMLWAPFHYALSISSVKVVRHKKAVFFCGRLWKGSEFEHCDFADELQASLRDRGA